MKGYYVVLCIMSIAKVQICSFSDTQLGTLQEAEYELWDNKNNYLSLKKNQEYKNYEVEPEDDLIDCQTKAVNCCLACLMSTPCMMYIASLFME